MLANQIRVYILNITSIVIFNQFKTESYVYHTECKYALAKNIHQENIIRFEENNIGTQRGLKIEHTKCIRVPPF